MDTQNLRGYAKLSVEGANFDEKLTFYYDETNNGGKFHLKAGHFNVDHTANFVLGGFVYKGKKPYIENIFHGTTVENRGFDEIKFKHIAWGNFETCLQSSRLNAFLNNLLGIELYLHLSGANLFYYSLVDIVDSAIESSGQTDYRLWSKALKDCLYIICKEQINRVVDLFFKYQYPAIKRDDLKDFSNGLSDILRKYQTHPVLADGVDALLMLLSGAIDNNSLIYIERTEDVNEEDAHILIDGLVPFYQRPIYLFIHSMHFFDNEMKVGKKMAEGGLTYQGKPLTNYTFLDSKSDLLIQASDVIVGLIGKFYKFINTKTHIQIIQEVPKWSKLQHENLDLFLGLIEKSIGFNQGLLHYVDGQEETSKIALLGKLRGKNI